MKNIFLLIALSFASSAFAGVKIECRNYKYAGDEVNTATKPFLVANIPNLTMPKSDPERFKPVGPLQIKALINGKQQSGSIKIVGAEFIHHGNLFINLGIEFDFNGQTIEVFEEGIREDERGIENWVFYDNRHTACIVKTK